ncbi:MAG: putative dynein heavy chain axonemal, partial [Streblomastix strix]
VTTMVSVEGESVELSEPVSTRMAVETWLLNFESAMCLTIRDQIQITLQAHSVVPPGATEALESVARAEQKGIHPGQEVQQVNQSQGQLDKIESDEENGQFAVYKFLEKTKNELAEAVTLVRGQLAPLERATVNTLIVVDVHARDIVETLVREKSSSSEAFEWMRNLRYYWDQDEDECIVRQTSTEFIYGYEYLGNSPRLVITPLTDRCYIT